MRNSLRRSFGLAALSTILILTSCSDDAVSPTGDGGADGGEPCMADTYRKCTTSFPGVCAAGEQSCLSSGTWGPCTADVQPGAQPERCTNSADDDCDGFVDDADMDCVACSPGDARDCTALAEGICKDGQQICSDEQAWGVCGPKVRPGSVQEDCGNGLDDDCDGDADAADDDCEACTAGDQRSGCSTGLLGACATGTQTCGNDSLWGACVANVQPSTIPEDCATSEDEDCDGAAGDADKDCQPCQPSDPPRDCPTGLYGICATGTQSCTTENAWGPCQVLIAKDDQVENCVAAGDEDCDGLADSADSDCWACLPTDPPQSCSTGLDGICAEGVRACTATGSWSTTCTQVYLGRAEDCGDINGADEDCDGTANSADSDCYDCLLTDPPQTCDTGQDGVCQWGERVCLANGTWSTSCTQTVFPGTEDCNDALGQDEDCDGWANAQDTNSGCCFSSATEDCDAGNAYCTGVRTCTNNEWGGCELTYPSTEAACDGSDENCNGVADDGTFLQGPTLLMEYLSPSISNRLFGHNGNLFFFGRVGNSPSTGRWAAWNPWVAASATAYMLAVGDRFDELLNTLTTGSSYFDYFDRTQASMVMVGPPGFPNTLNGNAFSGCNTSGCLIVVRGSTVKMVNLGTRATTTTTLRAWPWRTEAPAATVPTYLRAGTGFPANTFTHSDDTPNPESVVVLVAGTRCWFWTPTSGELYETTAEACFCHPSGGASQSCGTLTASPNLPTAVINNIDALSYFPADDGSHWVGVASGNNHYVSLMFPATADWSITYQWSPPFPIGDYPCDHTPLP